MTPIRVYRFQDAPQELRDLSPHGGDEDWLAVIPEYLTIDRIPWMEEGTPFGCASVSTHEYPNFEGWLVKIGAHA